MIYPTQSTSGALSNLQSVEPIQHSFDMLWRADQVHEHLRNLHETIHLLKSVQKELEEICLIKKYSYSAEGGVPFNHLHGLDSPSTPFNSFGNGIFSGIIEIIKENKVCADVQESLTLEAANSLVVTLKSQLVPFNTITSQVGQWEEKSMAVKLAQKLQKHLRNKHWKKRKRRRVSEILQKEYEGYDKADQDADEWRANEIAKDIAKRKMENMKSIAKLKAMEERKRLESELELVLVVEKLQELRSIRIHKLKKQGYFLPEEDDKFLERVKVSVEEEERQASTSANTHAAKDAISTAEEISKAIQITKAEASDVKQNQVESSVRHEQASATKIEICSSADTTQSFEQKLEGQEIRSAYESVTNLPFEFYHYYHGSNNDMGTLIEVRRIWDAYIRPGGSRIPGHWVQAPPPSDEVWASYLVGSKNI